MGQRPRARHRRSRGLTLVACWAGWAARLLGARAGRLGWLARRAQAGGLRGAGPRRERAGLERGDGLKAKEEPGREEKGLGIKKSSNNFELKF
jgi:hypothetical protein